MECRRKGGTKSNGMKEKLKKKRERKDSEKVERRQNESERVRMGKKTERRK